MSKPIQEIDSQKVNEWELTLNNQVVYLKINDGFQHDYALATNDFTHNIYKKSEPSKTMYNIGVKFISQNKKTVLIEREPYTVEHENSTLLVPWSYSLSQVVTSSETKKTYLEKSLMFRTHQLLLSTAEFLGVKDDTFKAKNLISDKLTKTGNPIISSFDNNTTNHFTHINNFDTPKITQWLCDFWSRQNKIVLNTVGLPDIETQKLLLGSYGFDLQVDDYLCMSMQDIIKADVKESNHSEHSLLEIFLEAFGWTPNTNKD